MPSSSTHDSLRECWKYRSAASTEGPMICANTRSRSLAARPPGASRLRSAKARGESMSYCIPDFQTSNVRPATPVRKLTSSRVGLSDKARTLGAAFLRVPFVHYQNDANRKGEKIDPDLKRLPLQQRDLDRKSTRLNSSYPSISYAVFCLKKKTKKR